MPVLPKKDEKTRKKIKIARKGSPSCALHNPEISSNMHFYVCNLFVDSIALRSLGKLRKLQKSSQISREKVNKGHLSPPLRVIAADNIHVNFSVFI